MVAPPGGRRGAGFRKSVHTQPEELTGNTTEERDLAHFAEGLAAVYARMARTLKPGAPLAFTYHHNRIEAYYAVGAAVLDAGAGLLGLSALSSRNERLDPHSWHRLVHRGYGLRLSDHGQNQEGLAL